MVDWLTESIVKRSHVIASLLAGMATAAPSFGKAPTLSADPSLKVIVPARIWSLGLGLSLISTVEMLTGPSVQSYWIQAPAPWALLAHSLV